ncbi:MAG TPA: class I SAM-dependent methyltransferase [Blastocatellia bacterium]|nr:class I SAM-dependent methyltransferase [Blastocatellia bacterium]
MSKEKEAAYRYDLFVTPDWRDRFDQMVNDIVKMPQEGRILDVNCGTGAHAIEIAERIKGKGEVVGLDPDRERVEIARAKAQVKRLKDVTFEQGSAADIPFDEEVFDAVIGDASMSPADEVEDVLAELVRVARPGARVVLKMTTHGSFDEFFSIYWEALLNAGIVDDVWAELERLINERITVSDAEQMAARAGLRHVQCHTSKEAFPYETGRDFLYAPLIEDNFLADWLAIVPEARREEVRENILTIIERERHDAPFEVSIKATLIEGIKSE